MGTWTGLASGLAHDLPIGFWEGVNMATAGHFETPQKYIKSLEKEKADFNDKYLSEATKAQKRRQARILKDEDQNALDTVKGVFQNPAAVTNMAGESIPEMLAMTATSGSTAVVSKFIKPALTAMERLALANKTALGLNAFVNAADTFNSDELKDASTSQKYLGAGISGAGSYLANKAFDNATMGTLLKKALAPTFAGQSLLKTAGKEFGQEFLEESANALGEQLPLGQFDFNEFLKRGALGGTVGGFTAGGVHAAAGLGKSRVDPDTPAREVSANRPLAWKGWEQAVTPKDQPPKTKASEESTPQTPLPLQAETKAPEAQPVKAKEELPKPVEEVLAQPKQDEATKRSPQVEVPQSESPQAVDSQQVQTRVKDVAKEPTVKVEPTTAQEVQDPAKVETPAPIETSTVVEPPQADTPEEQAEFERGYRVGMEQLNAARDSEEKTPENSQGVLAKAVNTALGQLETPNESAPQTTEAAQEVTKAVDQVIPQKEVQPSAVKNETPKLSLEQYVAQQGHSMHYDGQLDKVRMPHGETESQARKRLKQVSAEIKAHGERLAELRQEYEDKVASGEIQKPSKLDSLLRQAHGHPDNPSVQAARRVLAKRGYDWQTGDPLNKADKLDVPASETPTEQVQQSDVQLTSETPQSAQAQIHPTTTENEQSEMSEPASLSSMADPITPIDSKKRNRKELLGEAQQTADTAKRRTNHIDNGRTSLLGDEEGIERTGEPAIGREQEGDPGSSGEDGIFKFSRKNGEQVDELHEKLKAVERDKVDIRDAFYREDIGSIDLLYGNKGFGIHHIISRRTEDGEIGSLGKERLLGILAYTIVNGKKTTSGRRIKLTHGASIVFLDKPKGKPWDNNFVLTGWARVIPKIKKSSGERRAAFLNSAPTSTIPTRRRYGGVAEDSANSLSEGDEKSIGRRGETTQRVIDELANNSKVSQIYKGLDNSRKVEIVATTQDLPESITSRLEHDDLSGNSIQAVYDSSSRKVYLISDNISEGTAEGVFLHEVGVHMAADQNYRKDMSALIARARQIVMNGKRNGDKTAGRVYQRMVDAGLIDENGKVDPANQDEFFAYLVEELANAKTDQGIIPAIKRWFTDVLAKVKTWLYDHGFISSNQLNQRDLLTIAKGNAEGLSKTMGERSGSGDVLIKKSVASDIGLKDAVKDKIDGGKRTLRDSVRKNLGGDWGSPLQKDELGKTKFAWGEHIVVGGTNVALDVAESFLPAVRSVRYLPKDMRKIIRRYAAQVDKAVQDSGEISTDMQAYSANDRKLISDIIEDMVKTGVNPPAHVVDMASKMSTLMTQQTDQLLELGMISRESADRYRGHYLPRFYRNPAKVDGKENIFTKLGIRKPLIEGIGGSHLKGRGCFKAVTAKEVKNFVELGWEVRDSRYKWDDAKQKLVSSGPDGQWFDDVYDEAVVGIWRDWTPEERQRMGEVRDAGFRFVMGWMSTQKDIALGRMFKAVSENPEYCSTYEQEGFVKVPETEITETAGVKRYGALAGKYVRKDILDYLSMHVEAPSAFAKVWKKALAYWKEGKTAHNPVSHMNNVMGNVIMSHLAGISMGNAKAYLGLIKDIVNKASWIK